MNPKPGTLDSKPLALNLQPYNLNPINPEPESPILEPPTVGSCYRRLLGGSEFDVAGGGFVRSIYLHIHSV